MKFTYSWLKKYLDTNATVDEMSDTLTKIGIEVEEVINPADSLKDFIIADVKTVENHPNSDHLHVLSVWDGKQTLHPIFLLRLAPLLPSVSGSLKILLC